MLDVPSALRRVRHLRGQAARVLDHPFLRGRASPDDTASWPDPWWDVFCGLHSVLGYRTIMYIADGTSRARTACGSSGSATDE
jgi:hypothetical protein